MSFALEADTADQLTAWANSPGGTAVPDLNRSRIAMPDLAGLAAGWDAPLPPPARIDIAGIELTARTDMSERFANLPQLNSYWRQPAGAATPETPAASRPGFMQAPAAAEPQVYYGEAAAPASAATPPAAVSMGALNRAERYAQDALGNTFNATAAKPMAHMANVAAPVGKRPSLS